MNVILYLSTSNTPITDSEGAMDSAMARDIFIATIGAVIGTLSIGVIGTILAIFTKNGQALLGSLPQVRGIKTIAIVSFMGLFIALFSFGVIVWRFILVSEDVTLEVVNGDWSRGSPDSRWAGLYAASVGQKDCPSNSILLSAYCSPDETLRHPLIFRRARRLL